MSEPMQGYPRGVGTAEQEKTRVNREPTGTGNEVVDVNSLITLCNRATLENPTLRAGE